MKRSGYWIIGLVGILLGSQFALPIGAEMMLERSLNRAFHAQSVTAQVDALPALSLLNGTADEITLMGKNVPVGRLVCEEVTAELSDVKIDTAHLLQDGKVLIHRVGDAHFTAAVTEQDLAEALRHSVKQLDDPTVVITPEGIEASGAYTIGKTSAKIALTGQIICRDDKIFFVSEQVQLQYGTRGSFSANLKTEVELAELRGLPFAVRITEIRPTDGRILLAFQKAEKTK